MSPARFGLYTLAGCIPWTAALAWAGYAVGANWQHVVGAFHGVTYVIVAVIVLLVVVAIALLVRRRLREPDGEHGGDGGDHSGKRDLAGSRDGR
jgi:membrane protein DedA with SNARE-associated domain